MNESFQLSSTNIHGSDMLFNHKMWNSLKLQGQFSYVQDISVQKYLMEIYFTAGCNTFDRYIVTVDRKTYCHVYGLRVTNNYGSRWDDWIY
jgi:hypothetical protein